MSAPRRSGYRYRTERTRFKHRCQQSGAPCWRCGRPIDYNLRHPAPMAFELDHYHPVITHRHLIYDPTNFRPAHARCNHTKLTVPDAGQQTTWKRADW